MLEVRGRGEWADLLILEGVEGVEAGEAGEAGEGLGLRLLTGLLLGHILMPRDLRAPEDNPDLVISFPAVPGPTRFSELPKGDLPLTLLVPAILFVDLAKKLFICPEVPWLFSNELTVTLSTDRDLPPYRPGFNLEGDGEGDGEAGACDFT